MTGFCLLHDEQTNVSNPIEDSRDDQIKSFLGSICMCLTSVFHMMNERLKPFKNISSLICFRTTWKYFVESSIFFKSAYSISSLRATARLQKSLILRVESQGMQGPIAPLIFKPKVTFWPSTKRSVSLMLSIRHVSESGQVWASAHR